MNPDWDMAAKIAGVSAKLHAVTEDLEFLTMEKTPIIRAIDAQHATDMYRRIEEDVERRLGRLAYAALLPDTTDEECARLLRVAKVLATEFEVFKKGMRKKTLDLEHDVLTRFKEAGAAEADMAEEEKGLTIRRLTLEYPQTYDAVLDGFEDEFLRAVKELKGEDNG